MSKNKGKNPLTPETGGNAQVGNQNPNQNHNAKKEGQGQNTKR